MIASNQVILVSNLNYSMAKFRLFLTSLCIVFISSFSSFAQVNAVEYGKNRVQHKKFKWEYYQTKNFNTYFLIINNDNQDEAYFCFEKAVKEG